MAKFKGIGLVWDKDKNKALCKFKNGEYETNDKRVIDILKSIESVELISDDSAEHEHKKTKKQLIAEAKAAGITGADRMSKEEIRDALAE